MMSALTNMVAFHYQSHSHHASHYQPTNNINPHKKHLVILQQNIAFIFFNLNPLLLTSENLMLLCPHSCKLVHLHKYKTVSKHMNLYTHA